MKQMKNKLTGILLFIMILISDLPARAYEGDTNIARGREYTIEFGAPTEYSYRNYTENGTAFDIDTGCLTDGKYGSEDIKDARYYQAFRSVSRFVCFDLGAEMRVSGYGGSFLHYNGGIYAPAYLKLWLSQDGEHYVCVSEYDTEGYSEEPVKRNYEIPTDKPYKARYVKVEFEVGVFVWCDEITVFGSGDTSSASALPEYTEQTGKGYYPQGSDAMNGVSSIIKIYDGYYENQEKADNTSEELLPYIAYMQDGEILDTMFDTVAFVPCHTDYPSGGRLTKSGNSPGAVMSDWELYISRTFHSEYNLASLDEAAGKRNEALGMTEKVKVLLTVPYPLAQSKPFGDIDGDGKDEYTRTAAERVEVVKWYVNKVCNAFDGRGFKNLELAGFYWYREEIGGFDSEDESAFITGALEAIHAIRPSARVLYDPFYLSVGFDKWREYGFDSAVMQPNLVFRQSYYQTQMLGEFAQTIAKYGLGVEIETAEPHNFDDAEKRKELGEIYENYLYYGWKTGYMNALQTFYQGAGPGTIYKFYTSDDAYLNYLYTLTYRYIKRDADLGAPELLTQNVSVEKDKKRAPVDLEWSGDLYAPDFEVEVSSENGKCQLIPSNRRFLYTPDTGFAGTDTVKIKIKTKFGDEAVFTLDIEVYDPDTAPSAEESAPEIENETSSPGGEKGDDLPLGVVIATVAGAAAAIIAAVIILKKRRK